MDIAFGIILIVLSVIIIGLVLVQSGKDKSLSGAITGGSDSFFGQSKAKKKDKILSKVTLVVSIIFALVVIAAYCLV